jgi:hypothetical protein
LALALELAAALRRLLGVDAVQHEWVGEVVAVGVLEQPRPQVEVLALLEARVVAEAVPVEGLALDQHRRMKER